MRPIFAIHAGEFLVGEYLELTFKNVQIWVPAKDTGIDLLVTNSRNTRAVSFQSKVFSGLSYDLYGYDYFSNR